MLMITFSELGNYGRLGNQLFQYAACKSISLEKGYDFKIPDLSNKIWHGQKCLLNKLNISAEEYNYVEFTSLKYLFKERTNYIYQPKIKNIRDNTNFFGFFQDKRYFINHIDELILEFTPKENFIKYCENKINKIKDDYNINKLISIHIRRGDVVGGNYNNHYFNNQGNIGENSWFYWYLKKSIKYFGEKKIKYFVFTGGNKNNNENKEYEWCENNFNNDLYIINKENNPIVDFTLMSLCDGNILSPHSTFGYWAALINKNKSVVAPKDYLIGNKNFNYKNFFPTYFKII